MGKRGGEGYGWYGGQPPHQTHSATSRAAGDRVLPNAGTQRRMLLDFIVARGNDGATDEEAQRRLSMSANTQRPRRRELEQSGLVENSGRTRLTTARRKAVVWVVVASGGQGELF